MRLRGGRRDTGFTLIEILVTIAIIAILAAILIANFLRAQSQAKVAASKTNVKNIAVALESYFSEADAYPAALSGLVPTFARGIPTDPCTSSSYGYTALGGMPPSDYKISITFSFPGPCSFIAPGISYTPGGGLVDSP